MSIRTIRIFLFLFVSIIIFTFNGIVTNPFAVISSLFTPIRVYLYESVHAQSGSVEVQNLRKENSMLSAQLTKLKEIKKDNVALRSQFMNTTISSLKLIPARVVGFKGAFNNPDIFIIDQGSSSGIKKGMAVVLEDVLVGKIREVNNTYSEVLLVTNKDFTTLGITLDHNSPGIVRGLEDFIFFDHIVITDTILKGEKVLTKGELNSQGLGIPPGLVLGSITKVNKSESKPFQNALIMSPLDFRKITTLFIVSEN